MDGEESQPRSTTKNMEPLESGYNKNFFRNSYEGLFIERRMLYNGGPLPCIPTSLG